RAGAARRDAAHQPAGPIDGVVDEPAEIDAYGPRAVSPMTKSTRSSGNPSSSAGIRANAVAVPGRAHDDIEAVERHPKLLARDLRHRGRGARADVLHSGDHRCAPVRAHA